LRYFFSESSDCKTEPFGGNNNVIAEGIYCEEIGPFNIDNPGNGNIGLVTRALTADLLSIERLLNQWIDFGIYVGLKSKDYQYVENILISEVSLMDVQGKLITHRIVNKNSLTLDLNKVAAGIYLIKIIDEDGYLNIEKIIVSK